MELFKYCKSSHMESILENGSAKIGTFFDWRRTDAYGDLVTDPREGHTNLTGNLIFYDPTHISEMIVDSSVEESTEFPESRNFKNSAVRSADHFAFSASMTYSVADHEKWYALEKYDACYRIHSSRLFFRALSHSTELNSCARLVCAAPVLYFDESSSNNVFRGTFHPGLLKRSTFGSQNEFRALWAPLGQDAKVEPLLISTSNAKLYISRPAVLPTNV